MLIINYKKIYNNRTPISNCSKGNALIIHSNSHNFKFAKKDFDTSVRLTKIEMEKNLLLIRLDCSTKIGK